MLCWNVHDLGVRFTSNQQWESYPNSPMVDNVPDRSERRRYPRIKANVPVELLCPGAAPMRTSTDEISLCGCYIESMFTMEVGTKVGVVLSVKGQNIRTKGIVVTKYPQVGNGIDFVELSHDDSRKLGEFISEHQHEDDATGAGA